MKVVIIGAGAAGLAIGWRLRQAGVQVTILERAQPAQAATWAAAGMIAVAGEVAGGNPIESDFSSYSSALWPDFARELEQASDTKIGYRRNGALIVHLPGEASDRHSEGGLVEAISSERARVIEPELAADLASVFWAPNEAQVDNRALGQALARAFVAAGGELALNEAAVRFDVQAAKAVSVQTPFRRYEADAFVIAAGAWSGLLEGLPEDARLPVRPVKGEMISLAGSTLPSHVVRGKKVYLVPRGNRLLVGATVEEMGFETHVTPGVADTLFENACALVPSLATSEIVEHWAGLRPGTPDDMPILGPTSVEGLHAATGQFRNGILFTPAIAELMRGALLGTATVPGTFDARRFARK